MKRSSQVSLVLMTVAGIGAGAWALAPDDCRQSEPNAVPRDPPKDCRSSGSHSSGGHASGGRGAPLFSSNSGPTADGTSASTSRGGFGWIGHALSRGS